MQKPKKSKIDWLRVMDVATRIWLIARAIEKWLWID